MGDDLIPILTRFHREVLLPDIQRVVGELRGEMNERFAALDAHFDEISQRFDKLETEYQGQRTWGSTRSCSSKPSEQEGTVRSGRP